MQFLGVILAAFACYAFGAVYYMSLAKPWMAAAGLSDADVNKSDKTPFIIAGIGALIAAGMLRHILTMTAVDGLIKSATVGGGIGLFIVGVWIFLNNGYEGKSMKLSLINTGYSTLGLALMGAVLSFF